MSYMTSTDYSVFVTILLERLKVVKNKHVSVFLWYKKGLLTDDGFYQTLYTQKSHNHIEWCKIQNNLLVWSRDSSVGIATRFGLDDPGVNPGGGRFSAPVQTSPGAHPASCTIGTGSFPGVKRAGRGVAFTTHPHLVLTLKKE
jgi:hypothetical protein